MSSISEDLIEMLNLSDAHKHHDIDADNKKFRAQCMIEAVKSGIYGLQEKSKNGGVLNELEVVGLAEILGIASDIIDTL